MLPQNAGRSDKDHTEIAKLALDLLETPIHQLMENLENQKHSTAQPAESASASTLGATHETSAERRGAIRRKGKSRHAESWTDKYRPKTFTELLGDEVSNAGLALC